MSGSSVFCGPLISFAYSDADLWAAEWSFQYLRGKAQQTRETTITKQIDRDFSRVEASVQPVLKPERHVDLSRIMSNGQISSESTLVTSADEESFLREEEEEDEDDDQEVDFHSIHSTHSSYHLDPVDFYSISCDEHHVHGRLVVSSQGFHFVRSFPRNEMWRRGYEVLIELRKVDSSIFFYCQFAL